MPNEKATFIDLGKWLIRVAEGQMEVLNRNLDTIINFLGSTHDFDQLKLQEARKKIINVILSENKQALIEGPAETEPTTTLSNEKDSIVGDDVEENPATSDESGDNNHKDVAAINGTFEYYD